MRFLVICIAAAVGLTACGQAAGARQARGETAVPTLEVRSPRQVRVYTGTPPRCPVRDAGTVWGRSYRDLQTAAYRLRANAVLVDQHQYGGQMTGMALQFTRADCQR